MKYQDFYDRKRAFEEFKIIRNNLNKSLENPRGESFSSLFSKIKKLASEGDVVAQDVVAYFYRDGAGRYLSENYPKYMAWQILSASNGNKFAIEKLQFFMGYAYDTIVDHEDFGIIKYRNQIDEYNYIYIIGQKICQALVEELGYDAKTLGEESDRYDNYKPEQFRDLRKAIDKVLPKVIEDMKK